MSDDKIECTKMSVPSTQQQAAPPVPVRVVSAVRHVRHVHVRHAGDEMWQK